MRKVYFNTYSEAIQYAYSHTEDRGYKIDDNDWFCTMCMNARPRVGFTKRGSVSMTTEKGNPARKYLHVQVYAMETGSYELNFYLL